MKGPFLEGWGQVCGGGACPRIGGGSRAQIWGRWACRQAGLAGAGPRRGGAGRLPMTVAVGRNSLLGAGRPLS